jgi:tetratricopeptide (TPR) repeat protein
MQSRYDEAGERYSLALALYRELGARSGEAIAGEALGDVARAQRRYDEAADRYTRALALYRELGDRLGEASTLDGLARVARAHGDEEEARILSREAQRILEAIGLTDATDDLG